MIIVNHLIRKQHLSIVQSVPSYLFVKILLSKTWRLIVPASEYEKNATQNESSFAYLKTYGPISTSIGFTLGLARLSSGLVQLNR